MAATDGDAGMSRGGLQGIAVAVSLVAVVSVSGCFKPPSYSVEKTIGLPDSLSGLSYKGIAYDARDNRILVSFQHGGTLVIDAATGRKVSIAPAYGPGAPFYDPAADDVYLSAPEPSTRTDTNRDSTLSALAGLKMDTPEEMCVDPVANRVFYRLRWAPGLTVLDSRTLSVVVTIPSRFDVFGPNAVCSNPRMHRFYSTPLNGGPLAVTDAQTGQAIGAIEMVRGAVPLCYNSRENKLYVSGTVTHSNPAHERGVLVLDCWSNRIVATISVAFYNDYMCYNAHENKVYGAGRRDSSVIVIDGASDRVVAKIRMPGETDDYVYDSTSNRLYCCGKDWVAAIDCRSGTVVGLVRTNTRGGQARAVFCAPVDKLYYLQWNPCELYRIDCERFAIEGRTTVGYEIGQVFYSRGQDKVYCTTDCDEVVVVDAEAESVRSIVPVGSSPFALCSNSDGTRVYCANMQGSSISVIDGLADTVFASFGVGRYPVALSYSHRYNKLYCLSLDSTVSVIDCGTLRVIKKLAVATTYWPSILYDSVIDRVFYIAGYDNGCVAAIDTRRDSVLGMICLAGKIHEIVHDPASEKLYCTAWDTTDIYVVGCRNMKTRGMVKEGPEPWPYGILPHPHIAYVKRGKGIAIINTDDDYMIGMVDLATKHEHDAWHPNSFAYAPRHRRLFVAKPFSRIDVFRQGTALGSRAR